MRIAKTSRMGSQKRRRLQQGSPASLSMLRSSSSTKMLSMLVALLLICSSFNTNTFTFVEAEDYEQQGDDEEGDGEDYYNKFDVCADSVIMVEELSIVCDSPGAYYYGSGKYRNSAMCQAGDKAKLEITIEIQQDLGGNSNNDDDQAANDDDQNAAAQNNNNNAQQNVVPYLYLTAQGYGTVESEYLYDGAELCSLSSLKSLDGVACPAAGQYRIREVFYWGDQSDNYEYTFKPHVTIGMASNVAANQYDLGGANTARCSSGGTFINWTTGVRNSVSETMQTFIITFTILMAVAAVLFGVGWLVRRIVNANDQRKRKIIAQRDVLADDDYMDEDDMRRIAMMARERDLIEA